MTRNTFIEDLVGLTLGVLIGLVVGAALTDRHHMNRPADEGSVRDLCVELATETDHPVIFIEGKGCVILVPLRKGART